MKRYLLLVVLCLMAVSCDQETNFYATPDKTSFVFGPEGGSFDDVLFTNGSWTCTVSDESVTVTPMSGDFTSPFHVEVPANTEMYTKSIRIQFTSKYDDMSRVATVAITQDCFPFLVADDVLKAIGYEGGRVFFTVNSNEPWKLRVLNEAANPAGFSVEPRSGGPNSTTVTIDIPANDTGKDRLFKVELYLESHPEESLVLGVIQTLHPEEVVIYG
jgi:hypothetical protein